MATSAPRSVDVEEAESDKAPSAGRGVMVTRSRVDPRVVGARVVVRTVERVLVVVVRVLVEGVEVTRTHILRASGIVVGDCDGVIVSSFWIHPAAAHVNFTLPVSPRPHVAVVDSPTRVASARAGSRDVRSPSRLASNVCAASRVQ